MRTFVLAMSVFSFFSSPLQATLPQRHTGEIQMRKWTTIPMDVNDLNGRPYLLKAFLRADEKCGDVKEAAPRAQCYRGYSNLPPEPEPLQNGEIEILPNRGPPIRITKETFCAALEAKKKSQTSLLGPCDAVWDALIIQQNEPVFFCRMTNIPGTEAKEPCNV